MSDGGEISEAEKLRIAEHFIKSSPPGQVKLVAQGASPPAAAYPGPLAVARPPSVHAAFSAAEDLGKVVPSHILTEDAVEGAIGQYNVENCVTVEAASGDRHVRAAAAPDRARSEPT